MPNNSPSRQKIIIDIYYIILLDLSDLFLFPTLPTYFLAIFPHLDNKIADNHLGDFGCFNDIWH